MESNDSTEQGNPGKPFGVNVGSHNIFNDTVGDIAGRDIFKERYYDFSSTTYYQIPPAFPELLAEERFFANKVVESLVNLARHFVPPILIAEVVNPIEVPSEFEGTFSREAEILLKSRRTILSRRRTQTKLEYQQMIGGTNWQLRGPLGFGKTTILLMLAFESAKRFLRVSNAGFIDYRHRTCLYGEHSERLPIYVDMLTYDGRTSLSRFIQRGWRNTFLAGLFQFYLENGKLLILLDHLDEGRSLMKHRVQRELTNLLKDYEGNQIIIASRHGILGTILQLPFVEARPFEDNQIRVLFRRYLGHDKGEALYHLVHRNYSTLLPWLSTPYIAWMAALVYDEGGDLPQQVAGIIDDFVAVVFKRELDRGTLSTKDVETLQKTLASIAFHLIRTGNGPEFSLDSVRSIMEDVNEDWLEKAVDLSLLSYAPDRPFLSFSNDILKQYFAGNKLGALARGNPEEFRQATQTAVLAEHFPKFERAPLFKPVSGNEASWDSVLPPVEPSRWLESIEILFALSPDETKEELFNSLLLSSCLTLAELATRPGLNMSQESTDKLKSKLIELAENPQVAQRARITALRQLGILGDPRIGDDKMRLVPGGLVQIGRGQDAHFVELKPFLLDVYPVTNAQYAKFIEEGGYESIRYWTDAGWHWIKKHQRQQPSFWNDPMFNSANYPVVGVSWFEADAYAQWVGKRLPTEAEWECACTWDFINRQKKMFPTGDRFIPELGNLLVKEYVFSTTPVGAYPRGKTPEGIFDLVGNVWEWLSTAFTDYLSSAEEGHEEREGLALRCLRGGSWGLDQVPGGVGTTRFRGHPALIDYPTYGFRCARTPRLSE